VIIEYIGAMGKVVTVKDVPIEDGINYFQFMLSFAIDADPPGNPQNGTFSSYWAFTLTPTSIKALNPNIRGLFGWSLDNKVLKWYLPSLPITKLISLFDLTFS